MYPHLDISQIKAVRYFILTFLIGFVGIIQVSAQTDSLILSNGDVIVGEIKSMDKGIIVIETDYSDSDFKIEWDKVTEIYSPRTALVTLSDGTRINEPINTNPDNPHQLIIGVGAARSEHWRRLE